MPKRNTVINKDWDLSILESGKDFKQLKSFDCGDDELNDFFRNDAFAHKQELLAEIYSFSVTKATKSGAPSPVAFVSFNNDAVQFSQEKRKEILSPEKVHYKFLPAVKIGRLGVIKEYQRQNIGTHLLNFTKLLFITENRTGCRFITIDAYNKPEVIKFYKKNDFKFLYDKDKNKITRIMYFDLKRLKSK